MSKLRRLNVTRRERVRTFTQSFIREEKERAIVASVNRWTTLAEMRPEKRTTYAATELAKQSLDSFGAPATKVVCVLVKGIELRTVVFEERAAVEIVRTVL